MESPAKVGRLHQSEAAFFVLIGLIIVAAIMISFAFSKLPQTAIIGDLFIAADMAALSHLLFASALLLVGSVVIGIFLIYPLIRTQAREGGELRAMTETLSARSVTLEQAALTDSLTGMQNRRYFDDALREYLEEFRRINKPIGLMIFDLDHFKLVNDTHGHDAGDEVLREVAVCLKDMTRYHDVVARLGGEEFAVVAPNMTAESLFKLAERIRRAIAALQIKTDAGQLKITTSVGLAIWDRQEDDESFYRRADKKLYQAKRMGRDRVSV